MTISIHAPPRGATWHRNAAGHHKRFQFTPLREGRQESERRWARECIFQFTPLREGRLLTVSAACSPFLFQFTPLREGRLLLLPVHASVATFQFTPLREGRHPKEGKEMSGFVISIHAPPRGATMAINSKARHDLFQFTPLREGRRQKICNFCKSFVQPLQISMA